MLQDTLTQAQEQVVAIAEEVAEVVAPVAETATEGAMGWSEMLMVALIGFLLVFVVLVLLIYVMRLMGWFFTRDRKPKAAAVASSEPALDHAISDQELAAAIATALKLYKSALHDQESEMLTINRITRAYSPWNSKIHGLTQVPEKK